MFLCRLESVNTQGVRSGANSKDCAGRNGTLRQCRGCLRRNIRGDRRNRAFMANRGTCGRLNMPGGFPIESKVRLALSRAAESPHTPHRFSRYECGMHPAGCGLFQASGQIPLWISQRKIPCESRLFVNSGRKCSASGCAMLCMPNWPILKTEQDDLHQRDGLRTPFTELVQQGFLTGFSSLQICLNVLDVPTSGCPEGHTYCRECFRKVMQKQRRCPACRHPLSEAQLQRNRPLEGMIARLRLRCKHAEHEGDDKVAASAPGEVPGHKPCAEVTADELRSELRAGGLDPSGRPELAVSRPPPPLPPSAGAEYEHRRMGERRRVECSQSTVWAWQARVEGLRDTAGCGWRGVVGELTAHLRSDCQFEPVPCPNTGCTETRARRRIAEHADGLCPFRLVACRFCAGAFVQKNSQRARRRVSAVRDCLPQRGMRSGDHASRVAGASRCVFYGAGDVSVRGLLRQNAAKRARPTHRRCMPCRQTAFTGTEGRRRLPGGRLGCAVYLTALAGLRAQAAWRCISASRSKLWCSTRLSRVI